MGRLQSIQILRFVAAALVVVCHSWPSAWLGAFGVDIFFVISGFIITNVMVAKTAARFLRDRVFRIYPVYYACSAIYVYGQWGRDTTAAKILATITLWPVYGTFQKPFINVAWTLSFEMLFYLGAALTLLRPRYWQLLLAVYGAALVGNFATHLPLFTFIGNPLILEFLLGVGVAKMPPGSWRVGLGALVIGSALVALQSHTAIRFAAEDALIGLKSADRCIVWGIPAAAIVWGAIQLERWVQGRIASVGAYLGDASYSIYLTHLLAISFALQWRWPGPVAMSIIMGVIFYCTVEQPLIRLFRSKKTSTCEHVTA